VPKFRLKVTHVWRDSYTSFKVKRSKIEVIRLIIFIFIHRKR